MDLTADEEISQKEFKDHCKRLVLGEDAQIMRRYLKLRMPFTHAPIPMVPQFSQDLCAIHARFDEAYYNVTKIITQTQPNDDTTECDSSFEDEQAESDGEPVEASNGKQNVSKYSFTQGAGDIDDFFGTSSASITSNAKNTTLTEPPKKRPCISRPPTQRLTGIQAKLSFKQETTKKNM